MNNEIVILDGVDSYEALLNAEKHGAIIQLCSVGDFEEWTDFRDRQKLIGGTLGDFPANRYRAVIRAPHSAHSAEPVANNRKEFWKKLQSFVDDYIDGYEYCGEGDYAPNENEKFLIVDCVAGLLHELDSEGYFRAQPAKVPESVIRKCEQAIEYASEIRGGCISGVREGQKRVRAILSTPQQSGEWVQRVPADHSQPAQQGGVPEKMTSDANDGPRTSAYINGWNDAIDAMTTTPQPAGTIPEGWKLVPVEPTEEMLIATSWPKCAKRDYEHMLLNAPQPPREQEGE